MGLGIVDNNCRTKWAIARVSENVARWWEVLGIRSNPSVLSLLPVAVLPSILRSHALAPRHGASIPLPGARPGPRIDAADSRYPLVPSPLAEPLPVRIDSLFLYRGR